LSGGERRRLQLVMVLATEPNLLILDEPTNDLDLDTLRSIEAFLDEWPGALVVASHDRALLDPVADHVLAIEPGGTVRRVPGGVSGWLAERRAPTGRASTSSTATSSTATTSTSGKAASSASSGAGGVDAGGGVTTAASGRGSAAKAKGAGPSPYTVGRQLRETEQAMVKAQKRVDQLTAKLATATDHTELTALGSELAAAQSDLDGFESRWLELAELQGR
ncbi:MAG: ATP-binding cassette domain-containing protein, partial [Ilumatobacteraceae bacterium]